MPVNQCDTCGSIMEPGVGTCGRCGAALNAIPRAQTRRGPSSGIVARILWLVALAFIVGGGWLLLNRSQRQEDAVALSPAGSAAANADDPAHIWPLLQRTYPDLRPEWMDAQGLHNVNIPAVFWDSMLASERIRLGKELDRHFPDGRWVIVTGRIGAGSG